ncbi:MAG: FixH family protein [Polyangiaceae bacterium]|nr:FixH family protein [Polyangiaceae bacterium]
MTKLVAALALAVLPACGSDPEPVARDLAHVTSGKGQFSAAFTPHPDPPTTGDNALDITLRDAHGSPVEGATLQIEPWMPGHGHGSPVVPEIGELGGGSYHATQIDFIMPGYWELTVAVTAHDVRDEFVVPCDVK